MVVCPYCNNRSVSKAKLFSYGFCGVTCSHCSNKVYVSKKQVFLANLLPLLLILIDYVFLENEYRVFVVVAFVLWLLVNIYVYHFPKVYVKTKSHMETHSKGTDERKHALKTVYKVAINGTEYYKKKVYILMTLINIVILSRFLLSNISIREMTTRNSALARPAFPLGYTLFPSRTEMMEQIFSINIGSVITYLVLMYLLTAVFLNFKSVRKNKALLYGALGSVIILALLLVYLNILFGGLLIALLISNLFILRLIINYYTNKSLLRLSIIYFIYLLSITTFGLLIEYYSLATFMQSSLDVINLVASSDYPVVQSAANVLLVSNVTDVFLALVGLIFLALFIYGLLKIVDMFRAKKITPEFRIVTFTWFNIFIFLMAIIAAGTLIVNAAYLIGFNYNLIQNNNDQDFPIRSDECFSNRYHDREMGHSVILEDLYFVSCFDTIEGKYSVYYQITDYDKKNPFDLFYEDVSYDTIYIYNEQGDIILESDYLGPGSQVYITTKEETDNGFMPIISYQYVNKDIDKWDAEITDWNTRFYDIDGNFIKEFEGIVGNIIHLKDDPLYYGGKFMIPNEEFYYAKLAEDDEYRFYRYDFTEGSTIEMTSDLWRKVYTDTYE